MLQKASLAVFILFAVLAPFPIPRAQAEDLPAQAGNCSLGAEKFEEIKAVQNDSSLDYFSRIKSELYLRKQLLGETMDCLLAETRALESKFREVKTSDADAQALYAQFAEWFPNAINYYELQKAKINDLGLEGSKSFARDLAEWREGNYKPAAKVIVNFMLWAQNQDLVKAARNRLAHASIALEALRMAPEYWEAKKSLQEAETQFGAVIAANQKARESLRAYDPSGESLGAIKTTLDSLSLTYKKLLATAELITTAPKE